MSGRLRDLSAVHGQSPWLDNLQRSFFASGRLEGMIARGVRGLTSNPTIFQKAIQGSTDYDAQFASEVARGLSPVEAYWELVISDIHSALDCFAPLHAESGGTDGFVSVEVDPALAHDGEATLAAARALHERIGRPNVMIKIPATQEGLGAIRRMISLVSGSPFFSLGVLPACLRAKSVSAPRRTVSCAWGLALNCSTVRGVPRYLSVKVGTYWGMICPLPTAPVMGFCAV